MKFYKADGDSFTIDGTHYHLKHDVPYNYVGIRDGNVIEILWGDNPTVTYLEGGEIVETQLAFQVVQSRLNPKYITVKITDGLEVPDDVIWNKNCGYEVVQDNYLKWGYTTQWFDKNALCRNDPLVVALMVTGAYVKAAGLGKRNAPPYGRVEGTLEIKDGRMFVGKVEVFVDCIYEIDGVRYRPIPDLSNLI